MSEDSTDAPQPPSAAPAEPVAEPAVRSQYQSQSQSQSQGQTQAEPPAPPPKRLDRRWLAGGIAVVLAAGAVIAYAALSRPSPAERDEAAASGMNVEVTAPAPPAPVPVAPTQLEVLSDEMAQSAPPAPQPLPPPPVEHAPVIEAPSDQPPDIAVHASFDCATARPGAEQMVCSDPALAAADRQMARAYRRALQSGAPPEDIRAEQRDWIALREHAAQRSPQALAAIYFQRIDDLNATADRY